MRKKIVQNDEREIGRIFTPSLFHLSSGSRQVEVEI